MARKTLLHYNNGRGRMESIRWLLAAAGEEVGNELCHFKLDQTLTLPEALLSPGTLILHKV